MLYMTFGYVDAYSECFGMAKEEVRSAIECLVPYSNWPWTGAVEKSFWLSSFANLETAAGSLQKKLNGHQLQIRSEGRISPMVFS